MIDKYAVMGNPISHSKSPLIHREFAKQTQQAISYSAIKVPLDQFAQYVNDFQKAGGKGLNITIPFKQEAFKLVNECTERAQIAAAVNTILFSNEKLMGDNTDGIGLVRDLTQNLNISLHNKKILILGAGGAVRGILFPLLQQNPQTITIANRTKSTAEIVAKQFTKWGKVSGHGFDQFEETNFDLVINGTSASLSQEKLNLPDHLIDSSTVCYDMMYGSFTTPFLQWAQEQGASYFFDGTGMLVEQAAESFYLWRGVRPDTKKVIALLHSLREGDPSLRSG